MINVQKSMDLLKQMAENEGCKYEEYGNNSAVIHTKHNVFSIRVFYSHVDVVPHFQDPIKQEDYWLYYAWVIVQ